tara:strand:- start:2842 stop:5505 length:2664 start_codon:yes stop_codon:yes gene_type:complete
MSVQLILYPQSYEGLNSLSGVGTEHVIDGINFSTINTSASSLSLSFPTYQNAINALNATMIVNTWYRFGPSVTPPTETSGDVSFVNTQGIMQKLSNLVVGQLYHVEIEASFANLYFFLYSGTVQQSVIPVTTAGTNSFEFTATSTTNTIVIYSSSISIMSSISVRQAAITGTGQVICDLYEDEDIPLTLSVDDFKNVAEQVQSYSKAFNLPATKRNNQIFDNIFEVTRDTSGLAFNPYVRTQCELKQDGFILFQGYLRLIDIQEKQGETSYNVNLYSEAIALADLLEDRTFNDLSSVFSELEHTYNYTEIRNSWQGILALSSPLPVGTFAGTAGASTTDVLRYPFVDWNHSFSYDPTTNFPVLPNLESAFRPFISIKYIIQNIFAATPFSFTSTFFDTADFGKLYMDFNWGGNTTPTPENEYYGTWKYDASAGSNDGNGLFKELRLIPYGVTGGQSGSSVPPNYNTSTYIITATTNNERYVIDYNFVIKNQITTPTYVEYRWLHTPSGGTAVPYNFDSWTVGSFSSDFYDGSLDITLNLGDTLSVQFKAPSTIRQHQGIYSSDISTASFVVSTISLTSATLNSLRGELGQWDFLKGIMTMFNLVSIPDKDNPNNIIIEPYNDIFLENSDSTQLDWTDKIDIEEIKLTPLTELNKKTIFKFVEDDDDWAFNFYKSQVQNHLYGSKIFDASTSSNNLPTILAGEEEIIAEPFAATVPKPLDPQFSDFIVPSIYSYNADDGTSEGFDNSPRIMYNNGVETLTSCTYFVPCQNQPTPCGDSTEDEFLQFSHLTDIPTTAATTDFHFGICQLIQPIGNPTTNNLFNTYWLPYFNELYNPDTRTMTLKVNLSAGDINTFKFYDTVFIKNREFRVNKIDYKPNDLATVEFILIP